MGCLFAAFDASLRRNQTAPNGSQQPLGPPEGQTKCTPRINRMPKLSLLFFSFFVVLLLISKAYLFAEDELGDFILVKLKVTNVTTNLTDDDFDKLFSFLANDPSVASPSGSVCILDGQVSFQNSSSGQMVTKNATCISYEFQTFQSQEQLNATVESGKNETDLTRPSNVTYGGERHTWPSSSSHRITSTSSILMFGLRSRTISGSGVSVGSRPTKSHTRSSGRSSSGGGRRG